MTSPTPTFCLSRVFVVMVAASAVSCASRRTPDDGSSSSNDAQHGGTRASAGSSPNTAGPAAGRGRTETGSGPAAGSGSSSECRGPGRYESGKEGSYKPCCAGLHEVFYGKPGYTGPLNVPSCDHPPLLVYACVRGECGDGLCEAGEAPACGCVEDCPEAAWGNVDAGTPIDAGVKVATASEANLAALPASCGKGDVVAQLQTSRDAIECGDLPVDASPNDAAKALSCARDALAASKPFQLFWHAYGTDSLNHNGVVARLENGALRAFRVGLVAANSFGSPYTGESAYWGDCKLPSSVTCTDKPETCFKCEPTGPTYCECAPANELVPKAPVTSPIAVRCESVEVEP